LTGCDFSAGKTIAGLAGVPLVFGESDGVAFGAGAGYATAATALNATTIRGIFFMKITTMSKTDSARRASEI